MTTRRFYPAFSCKDGFEEKYVVMDSLTKEAVSPPMAYHEANEQAGARNRGEFVPATPWTTALDTNPFVGWKGAREWSFALQKYVPYNPAKAPYWIEQRADGLCDVLTKPDGDAVATGVTLSEATRIASHV